MAQSAQFAHAGCYNNSAQKFTKPSPAPTGALPSLPEGSDSKSSIVYLPLVDKSPRRSIQTSPKKSSPRSPGKSNRYRPLDDAVNEETARLLQEQTRSTPKYSSQMRSTGKAPNRGVDEHNEPTSAHKDEHRSSEKPKESWQEMRVKSRKALKLRDLDRVSGEKDCLSGYSDEFPIEEGQAARTKSKAAKMRESYSSPALLGQHPDTTEACTTDQKGDTGEMDSKINSQLSPILVLAEQEPIQLPAGDLTGHSNNHNATHIPSQDSVAKYSASASQASPRSSDEESAKKRATLPANSSTCNKRCTTRSLKSNPNRASYPFPEAYPPELSDLESRLSARIAELEKKNAMLLNAFVAVINTSAGLAGSEHFSLDGSGSTSGYRSSGQSGGSGLRSSGTSGGYRTSGAELGRVEERYPNEMENGNG